MGNPTDIILTTDYDLQIAAGDFVVGDSTAQHQKCILIAAKGDFKQFPLLGVDLMRWVNDERPEDMMREIRIQLINDGMTINKMSIVPPSSVTIDAYYK